MEFDENSLLSAIEKCVENAEELISDADYLKKDGRLTRAYALYQLAMEESGKAMKMFGAIVFGTLNTEKEKKDFRRSLNDHKDKSQTARMLTLLMVEDLRKKNKEIADKVLDWTMAEVLDPDQLNNFKNYSLYTSFFDNSYKTPKEMISGERVNYIEIMAKNRVTIAKAFAKAALPNIAELKAFAKENPVSEQVIKQHVTAIIGKHSAI